jgi:hypothetical protein
VADQEKVEIVIDETPESQAEPIFDIEGLSEQEVELAKSHGLVKDVEKEEEKEDEHKEQPKADAKEDAGDKEEGKEDEDEVGEVDSDPKDFESMDSVFEKDEKRFHKAFTPNQKALYFKYKDEKRKRQEVQKDSEEKLAKYELDQLKRNVSDKKLREINRMLVEDSDNLTIEKLQKVIQGEDFKEEIDDSKPITRAELERIEQEKQDKVDKERQAQEKFIKKVELANQIGKSKYENFDEIANLANEICKEDSTGTYQRIIGELFINESIDEETVVGRVVSVAQLHPKFKEITGKVSPESQEKVNRAITNSKKRISSAAVSSSGKRVITSEDDLTPEDGAKMSAEQWIKLKASTRRRLLGG